MQVESLPPVSSLAIRNRGNAGAGKDSHAGARLSRESRELKAAVLDR